jgi:hypothetical protein
VVRSVVYQLGTPKPSPRKATVSTDMGHTRYPIRGTLSTHTEHFGYSGGSLCSTTQGSCLVSHQSTRIGASACSHGRVTIGTRSNHMPSICVLNWGANNADLYSVVLCLLKRVVVAGYSEYSHEVLHVVTLRTHTRVLRVLAQRPRSTHVMFLIRFRL